MAHHSGRDELLAIAADCRRLARIVDDEKVRAQLLEIADTFDREATQVAVRSSVLSASQSQHQH